MWVVPSRDPDAILAALDDEQRVAATSLDGPVVVLAGAGTGKTRAITHRIAYAAATGRHDPAATLAVTFTTKAAGELRSRLSRLGAGRVNARTFHSAALRQARFFWPRAYNADLPEVTENRLSLVAEACSRLSIETDTAMLRDLATEVSWAKVSNVGPADYAAAAATAGREVASLEPEAVGRVLVRYEDAKRRRGVIDFDDILLCTAGLLAERADVLAEVCAAYRHFVVDEYQDVSPLQQALLELWIGGRPDVCVVGDPDQTIHSFAGASSKYLTTFAQRHRGATVVRLVRDYRSTPQIVEAANAVAGRGRPGAAGRLVAQRPAGPPIELAEAPSEQAEAEGVARWLRERHREGEAWSDMAVLYRIHAQSPALELALANHAIPFRTRDADAFFSRPEVRQAVVGLRAARDETPGGLRPLAAGVLTGLGWRPEEPRGAGVARERWESWNSLLDLVEDFAAEHPEAGVADLVADLERRAEYEQVPVGDAVTLSTLHAAKGLEWASVCLYGIHEGTLPFSLSVTPDQIAEERRLLYVGVTRAGERLRVSWATARHGNGGSRRPSRFLDGLRPPQPEGARVRRPAARTLLTMPCRVCGRPVGTPAERKLRRHADCPASHDEATLQRLVDWRRQEAADAKLPAYCVFTDATLLAITEAMPTSADELRALPGIGPAKLERYGAIVLGLLAAADD